MAVFGLRKGIAGQKGGMIVASQNQLLYNLQMSVKNFAISPISTLHSQHLSPSSLVPLHTTLRVMTMITLITPTKIGHHYLITHVRMATIT